MICCKRLKVFCNVPRGPRLSVFSCACSRPMRLAFSAYLMAACWPLTAFCGQLAAPTAVPHSANSVSAPQAVTASLQPALGQVDSALRSIQVDHWKVSREWKQQLQNDGNSIQQDLAVQLPALFQSAQAAPTLLQPQMAVLQNVDALYDVLVRVTTAADLAGGKGDAATLDGALRQLESARKQASDQMQHAASLQNEQLVKLQAAVLQSAAVKHGTGENVHTIVVDNDTHVSKHRRKVRHKNPTPAASQPRLPSTPPSGSSQPN